MIEYWNGSSYTACPWLPLSTNDRTLKLPSSSASPAQPTPAPPTRSTDIPTFLCSVSYMFRRPTAKQCRASLVALCATRCALPTFFAAAAITAAGAFAAEATTPPASDAGARTVNACSSMRSIAHAPGKTQKQHVSVHSRRCLSFQCMRWHFTEQ